MNIVCKNSCSTSARVKDLLSKMSLEEKVGQMVQAEIHRVTEHDLQNFGLGSLLVSGNRKVESNTLDDWRITVRKYQEAALSKGLRIPILIGVDAVHGHSKVHEATIFPHNIGIGAANNEELAYLMGSIVAEEMKLTHVIWNFSPTVAVVQDQRWGRTYESYSSDAELVSKLAVAYFKGQRDHGVLATAKHFVADGGTQFGTGYPIDRGNTILSEEELRKIHLVPFKQLIESGLQVIIASDSSYNGEKVHASKYLLTDILKEELNFQGFVLSDWEAIHSIPVNQFMEKVEISINSGIDMLMQPENYVETISSIISCVKNGAISENRINDAVKRILTVKFNLGLFEDPYHENITHKITNLAPLKNRTVARKLVEESMVLLKNRNKILPIKRGSNVLFIGPGVDNIGLQCGGWTISWQGATDKAEKQFTHSSTILDGFKELASDFELEIITDETEVAQADVVILVLAEIPYAEFKGDTADLSLTGALGHKGNQEAIQFARKLNKPIITLIIAGRHVLIQDYLDEWDAIVMCYLPGTEGIGVAAALLGQVPFKGTLPMPWYKTLNDMLEEEPSYLFKKGYGIRN